MSGHCNTIVNPESYDGCPAVAECGNRSFEDYLGETCDSCPDDCGEC